MLFRRRPKATGAGESPAVGAVLALKRKGTLSSYVLEEDGSARAAREKVHAGLTITYDEDERRIVTPKKVSYHTAFRMFRQQTGYGMSVINASGQTGAIYGIEESRASMFTGRAIPLTYLVDRALKEDGWNFDDQPMLVAIFFGELEKPGVPLLVIGINADREMILHDLVPQVANFQTTVINILGSMASGPNPLRLGYDPRQEGRSEEVKQRNERFFAERVLRIKAESLLQLAVGAKGYPQEAIYRGFSQSTLSRLAVVLTCGGLVGTAGFAAAANHLRKATEAETSRVEAEIQTKRQEVRSQLLSRINGLGSRLTLDHTALMGAADEIWRPGTKVSVSATVESAALTLIVPNLREQLAPGSDRRSSPAARGAEIVISDMRVSAPKNWSRTSLETSGDMNAWFVSLGSAPVERDLLDLVSGGVSQGPGAVAAVSGGPGQSSGGASQVLRDR